MIRYDIEKLNVEPDETFEAIPDIQFDSYISDLEEDSDLHLGLIEEDEEDIKDYNRPKVLKKEILKKF